jgi:uncharacterized protein (TIGR01244 family)
MEVSSVVCSPLCHLHFFIYQYIELYNDTEQRQGLAMKPITVTAKLAVAPQPKLADFQEFRRSGFTAVVNNRPDGEDPTQLGSAVEAEAARAAGLGYVHIPVTAMGMTEQDARLLKETIEQAPGPVVAHCKSGARSFYLWVLSGDLNPLSDEELLAKATELGVDTNAARIWLAAHRNSGGNHK